MVLHKNRLKRYIVIVCAGLLAAFTLTACRVNVNKTEKEPAAEETAKPAAEGAAEEAAAEAEAQADDAIEEAEAQGNDAIAEAEAQENDAVEKAEDQTETVLEEVAGEMDLAGSWEDEISMRAGMDCVRNDDGSYDIVVHWGGSAWETAIWEIHGTYDEASGMLSYKDGKYSIHTFDDKNQETISGEKTTSGVFLKEGDKLRWQDSENSSEGLFVKVE